MKKIFLLFTISFYAVLLPAQSVDLQKAKNLWLTRNIYSEIPIGQDGQNIYLAVMSRVTGLGSPKVYTDRIYTIDKESMEVSENSIEVSNRHNMLEAINRDDKFIALYRSDNKKGDVITLSIATIDKSEKSHKLTDENSVSTFANPKFWPEYETAKSPDGTKIAVLVTVTGKNNMLENIFAAVVNEDGEFLWSKQVMPDFGGRNFSIGKIALDNNGTLYIPYYTCDINGDKVSNVKFQFAIASDADVETEILDAKFGKPQGFMAKVLKNGNVSVAGYYTDTYKNTMNQSNGYFMFQYEPKNRSFSDLIANDFSSNYAQKKQPALLSNVLANQQYSINPSDILELDNNSLVLCGEHRFVKEIRNLQDNSTTYQLLTKNILASTFLPDGTSHFSMIQKQQQTVSGFIPKEWRNTCISYTAFANNNDVYFVFNEDKNNIPYPGKGVVCGITGLGFNKPGECVLMKLTPDQTISQEVLPDSKGQLMRAVDFAGNGDFFVSGITKDAITISKYSVK